MNENRQAHPLLRPRTWLAALLVAAPLVYGGDAAADSFCNNNVSPLLKPALQGTLTLCGITAPDGPLQTAAAKACFGAWTNVKNLATQQANIYELASGWEAVGNGPSPYDNRLMRASAADAKLVISLIH